MAKYSDRVFDIPDGVDIGKDITITRQKIVEYLEAIIDEFGNFCDECIHLDQNIDECEKKYRPKKYRLEMGPFEYCVLRKKCKDFIKLEQESDTENIEKGIRLALDCNFQQYC